MTVLSDSADRPALKEHGLGFASLAREAELAPKCDVIRDPLVNIVKKIIEVMRGYKTRPNYFGPIKIDGLD